LPPAAAGELDARAKLPPPSTATADAPAARTRIKCLLNIKPLPHQ
jgi:hypothetical protein